jgi:hypothetical protein
VKFQPGQSGNPAGRRVGTGKVAKLRAMIDVEAILAALQAQALAGDVAASRTLLAHAIPALKPIDAAVKVTLSGSLAESGQSVMAGLSKGALTPDQGQAVMASLASLARLVETSELIERIEALERAKP